MYMNFPTTPEVRFSPNVNQIGATIDSAQHTVSSKCSALLEKLGWTTVGTDPATGEDLWKKTNSDPTNPNQDNDLTACYWRWYEAVAYEFTKFITIGDDQ